MGTIENIDNFINAKVSLLNSAVNGLGNCQNIISKLDEVGENYLMSTLEVLNDYFSTRNTVNPSEFHSSKKLFVRRYKRIIDMENFLSDLETIRSEIMTHDISDDMKIKIAKYAEFGNLLDKKPSQKHTCDGCGLKMKISPNMSYVLCSKCGLTEKLRGMIFEDEQFFQQDGQRAKHGNYDPVKHCRSWIDKIQARETTDIPINVLNLVRRKARCNRVTDLQSLSCETIRKYLQRSKYSKFNEHIPLIRKIITGEAPPQFNELERRKIIIYFGKIVKIYSKIKPESKTNTNYHPYYIMKIIEQIIAEPRRRLIISCIHMQAWETLIEHDRVWEKICGHLPEFEYIPTDRNAYSDV